MGGASVDWFDRVDSVVAVGGADSAGSASAAREGGSTGVIGSRSNGAGMREPTSRARVIAKARKAYFTRLALRVPRHDGGRRPARK